MKNTIKRLAVNPETERNANIDMILYMGEYPLIGDDGQYIKEGDRFLATECTTNVALYFCNNGNLIKLDLDPNAVIDLAKAIKDNTKRIYWTQEQINQY